MKENPRGLKKTEEALREAHKRAAWLARFPEDNPNPVLRASVDGRVLYCNPAAAKRPGWSCQVGELLPMQLLPLVSRAMAQGVEIQEDVQFGERFHSVSVYPLPEECYANIYGIDITERKQTEALLGAIHSITQIIHSTLDVDVIMQKAITEAVGAIGCETAAISLRKGGRWVVSYVHGIPRETIGVETNDEEAPHAALAAKTKRPIAIHDAFNDTRVNREHMKKRGVRSLLIVPLILRNETAGVLFLNYHQAPFRFSDAHIDFAAKLAATMSLALENARLFGNLERELRERRVHEQRIARLTKLYAVLTQVNETIVRTHEEQTLYKEVCRIVAEEGEFPLVWIGVVKDRQIAPVAFHGPAADYLKEIRVEVEGELGSGPTGTCVREDRSVINDDFGTNSSTAPWRRPALRYGFRASVGIPLHRQGEVVAALTLYAAEPGTFDSEQVDLLEALCADVSYALDALQQEKLRTQAEEALRKSEERARILSGTAGRLLATNDPQGIVNDLCRDIMIHLECHVFFNFLVDETAGRLRLNAWNGIPEEEARKIERLDYGVAVCGCAARDGVRIVATDIFNTPDPRTELVKSFGIQAYACHPLMAQGRLIGTLSFGTKTRARFSDDELALMKTVTDQVATAMERMRLIHELQRSRDELEIRVQERTVDLTKMNEALYAEIGQRRRAEEAVGKERQRLHNILEVLPAYLLLLTPDYHVSFANRFFRERYGEDQGRRCFEYLFERPEPCENCETYKVLKTHAPHRWEWTAPDSKIYDIFDFPFTDIDGSPLILEMGIDITERKRAEEAVKGSAKQLRYLSSKLLSAQEDERKRIAGEIHDTLGASLSAVKFKVEVALRQMEGANEEAAESLKSVNPVIEECIAESRRIQMDLRPSILDDLGLLATLSWFCRRFEAIYSGIRIEPKMEMEESDVPHPLKIVVFRVTQEGMNNIAKHSQADRIVLSLRKSDTRMELEIQDNGRGFSVEKMLGAEGQRRGLGLTSMRERVELSGGSFEIESAEGEGTILRASWPIA